MEQEMQGDKFVILKTGEICACLTLTTVLHLELELEVATLAQSGPEWEARGQAASRWRRQNGGGHSTGNAALNT